MLPLYWHQIHQRSPNRTFYRVWSLIWHQNHPRQYIHIPTCLVHSQPQHQNHLYLKYYQYQHQILHQSIHHYSLQLWGHRHTHPFNHQHRHLRIAWPDASYDDACSRQQHWQLGLLGLINLKSRQCQVVSIIESIFSYKYEIFYNKSMVIKPFLKD